MQAFILGLLVCLFSFSKCQFYKLKSDAISTILIKKIVSTAEVKKN